MGNGSRKDGPAIADRRRDKYAAYQRATQRELDKLPAPGSERYREEMDSHSSIEAPGVKAALALPRYARMAIGFALALVLLATGVGAVIVAVAKLL